MNGPDNTAEIISRYFDGESAPDNDAALADLFLTDPDAATKFVSTARVDAMLQRHLPGRRPPVMWKWIAAGTAAALATAAALTLIPRAPSPADENVVNGENWQPLETAAVSRTGISASAERSWDFYHRTDDENFVPLPDLKLERWEMGMENGEDRQHVKVTATYPEDWKRKQLQARRCTVADDGTIQLGQGPPASLTWMSLSSREWAETTVHPEPRQPPNHHWYHARPVYFDHRGVKKELSASETAASFPCSIAADPGKVLLYTNQPLTSWLHFGLRLPAEDTRILTINVFDSVSHASLNGFLPTGNAPSSSSSVNSAPLAAPPVFLEALLPSAMTIAVIIELGIPWKEQVLVLSPSNGSTVKNSTFESKVIGSAAGVWIPGSTGSSLGVRDGSAEFTVRLAMGTAIGGRKYPDKSSSCTFVIALPPGQEVEVNARTADGLVPATFSTPQNPDALFGLWSFETPLPSVQALIIRPLQRHRIFFTVPLPRDPWNGLNDGVTDALALRVPSIAAATGEARVAVSTFLGIDESKTYGSHPPPLFEWAFTGGAPLKNPSLREILTEIGKQKGHRIKVEPAARILRWQ